MTKLTKVQSETLRDIAFFGAHGTHYADHYAPIRKLVALGLIEKIEGRFSDRYRATDAGRAILEASK